MSDYTLEELLISRMAKEFRGNAMGVGATILSDLSARLAKALYVPDLFLTTASRAVADCDVHAKTLADEWTLAKSGRMNLSWQEMFHLIAHGKLQIWIGTVQLDQYGASNISVIGSWAKPKAQLVGARGVPDDLWGCETLCYHIRRHTPRTIVAKVDFVCGRGNEDGGGPGRPVRRARPGLVVTDLGVFDFEGPGGSMRVVSLHEGVTLERVQEKTGFAVHAEGEISTTPPPSAKELRVIREVIDPHGLRRLESAEGGDELLMDLWQRETGAGRA
ncbi:CoA-transferase [Bosea sp. 2KB_26]|uniref:CoA-transferase n=1 Tax=Bosea sp. 2KB_26 TaxID=3237475 RepID=UPI003F8F0683